MRYLRVKVGPLAGQVVPFLDHEAAAAIASGFADGTLDRVTHGAPAEPSRSGWGLEGATGGPCTRDTKRCPAAKPGHLPTPACCRRHRIAMLAFLGGLLDREGIPWWVDYGTLHGAAHLGGQIPHDKDEDLGIFGEDLERVLALKDEIEAEGYVFAYTPPRPRKFDGGGRIKCFLSPVNHTNVDVFVWYRLKGGIRDRKNYIDVDRYKRREFHESQLLPLTRIPYEDIMVSAPRDPKAFSEWRIGGPFRHDLRANHDGILR